MNQLPYQHYTCLLNLKFLKTSNKFPTLGVEPGNILLVGERIPIRLQILPILFIEDKNEKNKRNGRILKIIQCIHTYLYLVIFIMRLTLKYNNNNIFSIYNVHRKKIKNQS